MRRVKNPIAIAICDTDPDSDSDTEAWLLGMPLGRIKWSDICGNRRSIRLMAHLMGRTQ